jgi:stage V sporulation protein G
LFRVLTLTRLRFGLRSTSMKVTDVTIALSQPGNADRLRGFCSVTLDACFAIRDIKIISGPEGLFVAMPSRKLMANCPQCRTKNHLHARFCNQCGSRLPHRVPGNERIKMHCDVAHPINAEYRTEMEKEILAAFEAEVQKAQAPGYRSRQIGDGGESLAPSELSPAVPA